jgi:hypothetical protein
VVFAKLLFYFYLAHVKIEHKAIFTIKDPVFASEGRDKMHNLAE